MNCERCGKPLSPSLPMRINGAENVDWSCADHGVQFTVSINLELLAPSDAGETGT